MALLELYVERQSITPDQWIVADDGLEPATLTLGQDHIVRERTVEGGASLALNLLAALEAVRGDWIVIMEHDDWYAPDHIEASLSFDAPATGCGIARYYNVRYQGYQVLRSRGSSLCNTAFSSDLIPWMVKAAEDALKTGAISVDRNFWRNAGGHIHDRQTVVGIKGLPGRRGLGIGHNAGGWKLDKGEILREWIGDDAAHYL